MQCNVMFPGKTLPFILLGFSPHLTYTMPLLVQYDIAAAAAAAAATLWQWNRMV